jgi:hypothetical protein
MNQAKPMNNITTPKRLALLTAAILALVLSGCGYYNPYLVQGSRTISLYHSMWSNRTNEFGLENTMFQSQADWLRKSPLITLADSPDTADYILNGSIDRVTHPEISFGHYRQAEEERAELTVSFSIKDRRSGKIVWQKKEDKRQETYYTSQDPMKLQDNRKAALQEIADDFAEEIYLHLITNEMRPAPDTKK